MSQLPHRPAVPTVPRGLVFGGGGLIAASVVLALVARHTDIGAARTEMPAVVQSIDLGFEDRDDGAIRVVDATTAVEVATVRPGQDGFVRVALRSLAYDRKVAGAAYDVPFRLGRHVDGGLWLQDLATGRRLRLDAYGHGNALSFAQFLEPTTGKAR